MQAYQQLRKLNFSYAGKNNQLLINIDEPDARINKRQMFVTLYDIPDLNGNYMASPATAAIFIDRNPLRWNQKTYKVTRQYNPDDNFTFDIGIENTSGVSHTFTVKNLPKWLTVNTYQDIIDARSEQTLTFTINKDTNVGEYDDIIYLSDEDGMAEPLVLNITIEGERPAWVVEDSMKQFSMNMTGRVVIEDDIVTDSRDVVAAFGPNGTCMGVANVNYDTQANESMVYLTIFNSTGEKTSRLTFKLWHYRTGKIMVLDPSQKIVFTPNAVYGSQKNPVILKAANSYVQELSLNKGWNWVSFNVYSNDFRTAQGISSILSAFSWKDGDCLIDPTNNVILTYKSNTWMSNNKSKAATVSISPALSYRMYVSDCKKIELTGSSLKSTSLRTVKVKKGWNSIGYAPMVNLPVTTALADYLDEAVDGDVVKSQTEFAQFTVGANGNRAWKGNLEYMKPGVGYMLLRNKATETSFKYPFYEPNATFFENTGGATYAPTYANTMTITAVTEGVDVQDGDKLIALSGAEIRGEAVLTATDGVRQPVAYLSISGEQKAPISFLIERDGEVIASTSEVMTYETNAVSGTYDEPTRISFVNAYQLPQHSWYTLQGIKLQNRPTKSVTTQSCTHDFLGGYKRTS